MSNPSGGLVVVVLVNFNQDKYTIDCVRSVLNSTYEDFRLILIDNGSCQSVVATLKADLPVDERLLVEWQSSNLGYVGGVNLGMEYARQSGADYCVIMNNDTLLDSQAIAELVHSAQRYNDYAIVSGKVYNYGTDDRLQYVGQYEDPNGGLNQKSVIPSRNEVDVGQHDEECERGMLDDMFWLIPKKVFERIGLYSTKFFLYGEQNDYALRAKREGVKLIYTPSAKLWHEGGVSTCGGNKSSPRIKYWTTFATLKLAALHLPANRATKFITLWSARERLKAIVLFVLGRQSYEHCSATWTAVRHFKVWNEIRFDDNGYNPFKG